MMIFDQYSRYRAVSLTCQAVIRQQSALTESASIIDIGSGPYKLLGQFLKESHVTYVDPLLANTYAASDKEKTLGLDIFKDYEAISQESADLLVSIDTFEHIPSEQRPDFLEKIFALSQNGFILAFPCSDTPESTFVDNHVNGFFKSTYGEDYSWLAEHFQYGLPSSKKTSDFFKDKGLFVQTFRQGNCDWLLKILPVVLSINEFDFLAPKIDELSDFFNKQLAEYDIGTSGYRTILVATPQEVDLNCLFPKEVPNKNELDEKVDLLVSKLINNSFFPALRQLRDVQRKILDVERKSVEIGEWGLLLQKKLSEFESQSQEQPQKKKD